LSLKTALGAFKIEEVTLLFDPLKSAPLTPILWHSFCFLSFQVHLTQVFHIQNENMQSKLTAAWKFASDRGVCVNVE